VYRKDGQQTQEELQKRNLREELDERECKHYSSKDKSYAGIPTFSVSFCLPL
jgi:protein CWC15